MAGSCFLHVTYNSFIAWDGTQQRDSGHYGQQMTHICWDSFHDYLKKWKPKSVLTLDEEVACTAMQAAHADGSHPRLPLQTGRKGRGLCKGFPPAWLACGGAAGVLLILRC